MTPTAVLATAPAAPPIERDVTPEQRVDWLAPDAGFVRMPCFDSVPDTQDAVTAHQRECHDCAVEVYA